jgi:hypothetical protein
LAQERTGWHEAFYSALHLELEEYRDYLEFYKEYQLTTEPLRIDVLIVKKKPGVVIKKNIALQFRRDNIIEYKSPGDYISLVDFYKTMAYCYLYAALGGLAIDDISLTVAGTRAPREVMRHIRDVYGWRVKEAAPGIHGVCGAGLAFPIQFIESRKLSEEENLWLKGLASGLTAKTLGRLLRESGRRRDDALTGAYIYAVLNANTETVKEVSQVGRLTLDKALESAGLTSKWEARGEARGEERGKVQGAQKVIELLKSGKSAEEVIQLYSEKKRTKTRANEEVPAKNTGKSANRKKTAKPVRLVAKRSTEKSPRS